MAARATKAKGKASPQPVRRAKAGGGQSAGGAKEGDATRSSEEKEAPTVVGSAEMALLGLLSEGARHPYQIEKDVEGRDMRSWTDLSMSTIYKILRRLELAGLVEVQYEKPRGERARHLYRLKPPGRQALLAALRHRLSRHEVSKSPFDAAIYWSDCLADAEVALRLRDYREELIRNRDLWRCMVQYLADCGCPRSDQALCAHKAAMLEGELGWLDGYVAELEGAPGRAAPEGTTRRAGETSRRENGVHA